MVPIINCFIVNNPDNNQDISRLCKNYNPDVLGENLDYKSYKAYTLNKGSEVQLCMRNDDGTLGKVGNESKDLKIEINKRFGMPMFIPLISLISCFLLSIKRKTKNSFFHKYIFFFIGFIILMSSEITVRYSGISLKHTTIYYLIPLGLLPLVYLYLLRMFKYENLN